METNRNLSLLTAFFFLLLCCASCSSSKVTVHPSDSRIEFSDFTSFDFMQVKVSGDTSGAFHQNMANLKTLVVREMEERGLEQVSQNPDLKINLGINIEENTQTRETSLTDPGEWNYIGQRNYKWESKTVEVGTYKEGSLIMHLVDSRNNNAVWVGIIEGIMPENPGKRQKAMEKAVGALFDKIDQSGE